MRRVLKGERRQISRGLWGSVLSAGVVLACAGKTQSLNQVDDRGSGGTSASVSSGGSGVSDANSGGASNTASGGGSAETSEGASAVSIGGGTAVMGPNAALTTATAASASTTGWALPRSVFADKLDVLFVVDNSVGMADKQDYVASAARELLTRLLDPEASDFEPLTDVHLGVISSSIGAQGGQICRNLDSIPGSNETQEDLAHLIPTRRDGLASNAAGFLTWDPLGQYEDGESELSELLQKLTTHIQSVGETGCGFEAPLEAMYRFLVDPTPAIDFFVDTDWISKPVTNDAGQMLVDQQLLAQRAAFLRPDAALAIIILSDEDDCSISTGSLGYLTTTAANYTAADDRFYLPAATSACESDPNDVCCRSCGLNEEAPPPGCSQLVGDPGCTPRDPATDPLNLRCFDQKRRFGFDLLFPISRYVIGLTQPVVVDTHLCSDGDCPVVDNPLFPPEDPAGAFMRTPRDIFVLGLVGAPWQDLATEASLTGTSLTYQAEEGNLSREVWDLVLGDPSRYVPPDDPLMVASIEPRTGKHPITGEALADPASADPRANSINGHEHYNISADDLQFVCTFPIDEPRDCSSPDTSTCHCWEAQLPNNSPLCQPPGGGAAETTQYYVGAYPAPRHLEFLSQLPGAVPTSVCPKSTAGDPTAASFGYNPAMRALVNRMASAFGASGSD